MKSFKFICLVLGLLILGGCGKQVQRQNAPITKSAVDFNDCVRQGFRIAESKCYSPDGKVFSQPSKEQAKEATSSQENKNAKILCKNLCGDGKCQEIVCEAAGCPCAETSKSCPIDCAAKPAAKIANPASAFCENHGGKLQIRQDKAGGQTGYCVFADGSECEEWAYFRGECVPKKSDILGILKGKLTIGPFCPVERIGQPCPVPEEAYTSREVIVYALDGQTVLEHQPLSDQGTYQLTLKPGSYLVNVIPGSGLRKSEPKSLKIAAGQTVELNFEIDTGIR